MNTAIRVLTHDRLTAAMPTFYLERTKLINAVLIIVLLLSAFAVIYIKDVNRRLFIQYQGLQGTHDKLYEEWGKLLLEQSTWSSQARVQKIAAHRLSMNTPSPKEIVVLRMN